MTTVSIDESKARRLFKSGTPEVKNALRNLIPTNVLGVKLIDIVVDLKSACDVLEESLASALPFHNAQTAQQKRCNDTEEQILIARALNGTFVPDYRNSNQRKWRPIFVIDSSGFRFSGSLYDFSFALAYSGSRLCFWFESEEISNHFANHFIELHKRIYYNNY